MTKKEKLIVANLVIYAKAVYHGHNDVKELPNNAIKETEKILKK